MSRRLKSGLTGGYHRGDGLTSHSGSNGNTAIRLILKKPEYCVRHDGPTGLNADSTYLISLKITTCICFKILNIVTFFLRSKKENAEERAENNYNNAAYYNDSGEPFIEMVRTCSCGIVSDKELEEHCHAKGDVLYVAADELWKKGSSSNKAYDINSGELVTEINRTCSSSIAHDNEQEEHCHATNNVLYVAADEIWRKGSYVNNAQHKDSEELAIKKTTSCSCGIVQSKELEERYHTKNNILYVAADEIWKERT